MVCATEQYVQLAHQARGVILIHHNRSLKAETFTDTRTAV